ncbi:MAG: phosphoribosylformylglycinamidine cyclo-ligase [Leptospirales bacterium]
MDYKKAGVDTEKARKYVTDLKTVIQNTHKKAQSAGTGSVVDNFGGFAGIFNPSAQHNGANLVAATDGVGTKIHLAKQFNYLEGLGEDLVAMCVNDLYCVGATPLFFLDYIACGKLSDSWYHTVIESISRACEKTSMALLGGETAEHPGVMADDDFDLAGFCVGSVAPDAHLPKIDTIGEGDLLYGFSSSGLHSNGFSLVRKIFAELEKNEPEKYNQLIKDQKWIQNELLTPTTIYTFLPELIQQTEVKALAHITGGGLYENLERILPDDFAALVEKPESFQKDIFQFLSKYVKPVDLYSTFNMGIGIIAVIPDSADGRKKMESFDAKLLGKIIKRDTKPVLISGIDT